MNGLIYFLVFFQQLPFHYPILLPEFWSSEVLVSKANHMTYLLSKTHISTLQIKIMDEANS